MSFSTTSWSASLFRRSRHVVVPRHPHPRQLSQSISARPATQAPRSAPSKPSQRQSQGLISNRYEDYFEAGLLQRGLSRTIPFETCTKVQEHAMDPILKNKDVLVRSGTCLGRTTAYLIPTISRHLKWALPDTTRDIRMVVIAADAARAHQISEKVEGLLNAKSGIRVRCIDGRSHVDNERVSIKARRADILVITPGRFLNHLILTPKFTDNLTKLSCVVYDDADRFGNRATNEWVPAICALLPKQAKRQTLVFGRDDTPAVHKIAATVFRPKYTSIVVTA